jgi:hypothetical protein
MRQHQQIDTVRSQREMLGRALQCTVRSAAGADLQRHAIFTKKIDPRQPDLNRMKSEDIVYGVVDLLLLPIQHVLAARGPEPLRKRFTLVDLHAGTR